jgi:branched-subunit amino acid transport protein
MNSTNSVWVVIGLLTLVVFLSRNLFVIFGDRFKPKGRLSQALEFAPLAALVAIVAPEFVTAFNAHGISVTGHIVDGRVLAGLTAIVVGSISRNSLYALVSGSLCYAALTLI